MMPDWSIGCLHPMRGGAIYGKSETPSHQSASCALCQGPGPLYPNALPGAGLNFVNGAFRGSFPGMSEANSWQRFAICADLRGSSLHLQEPHRSRVSSSPSSAARR